MKLSPSLIATDYNNLNCIKNAIKVIEETNVDRLHLDVMDGKFVENVTFDEDFVKKVRSMTNLILDVHLMIENPIDKLTAYLNAGADILTIHYETNSNIEKISKIVRDAGKLFGISISPTTNVSKVKKYIKAGVVDQLLVMSVEPGACGQEFIETSLEKIREARNIKKELAIEVDGGINSSNINSVLDAGADIVVMGSAIFSKENIKEEINNLLS